MLIHADVQVTRDGVPIIYHDWRVHETDYELPVHELTLELFQVRGAGGRAGTV